MNIQHFLYSLLDILNEMSPYIILGFLIAGFLHEFVKPSTMSRHLSGRGWKPVVKAAALGVPLPLCSCGVLPTAVGLHRQGASKAATTSFLISTPQTGVDSIAATYSLLGLPMAILRPIAALVGGFLGGISVGKFDKSDNINEAVVEQCHDGCCSGSHDDCCGSHDGCGSHDHSGHDHGAAEAHHERSFLSRIGAAVKYGMVDMVASVGKWLVIGLIVAALITVFVPDQFLVSLSSRPILAMLAMIVIAVPMYVCATGSIPIAMSLMLKGLNPGAAFVLLMAGPAANFASVMVLGKAIGKRATAIYIASVVVTALLFGILVDYIFPEHWFGAAAASAAGAQHCHPTAGLFPTICTGVLLAALVYSFFWMHRHPHNHKHNIQTHTDMTQEFTIEGMACNHCRATVEKAISAVPGVESVDVNLSKGKATVEGTFAAEAVEKAVALAGFSIKAGC